MRKTLLATAAALTVVASPAVHADTSRNYTITIDGRDITTGPGVNSAFTNTPAACLQAAGNQTDIRFNTGNQNDVYLTNAEPPQVITVMIYNPLDGTSYIYDPQQRMHSGLYPGDAQVTRDGKTYKVTGHIALYSNGTGSVPASSSTTVPFEFDATCQ